jgi:zinc/manganese transport system substrate-binding protein
MGGKYVAVASVETNPNTDPHTFEASPAVARELAAAQLVVINGVGYDAWAQKMLNASPSREREVVDAQSVLGLPADTENPHLWYNLTTMPRVAAAIAADLAKLQPAHASYFQANLTAFDQSLEAWDEAIAAFKAKYAGTAVAVTEPVGDYLLQAAGCDILTPWSFQAAIMNGTDPSPQDVTLEESLFNDHRVKVFLYNQQVTDSLTASLLALAEKDGIPVVGVYETMPTGYTYQSWMMAETNALERAVADGTSTTKL